MKFRKKPSADAPDSPTVDAIQFLGVKNLPKVLDFILDGHSDFSHLLVNIAFAKRGIAFKTTTQQIEIPTIDGFAFCDVLDMIVRDEKGNFFPVKPGRFVEEYEDVPETEAAPV